MSESATPEPDIESGNGETTHRPDATNSNNNTSNVPVQAPPVRPLTKKKSILGSLADNLFEDKDEDSKNPTIIPRRYLEAMSSRNTGSFMKATMSQRGIGDLAESRFKRWKQEELIDLLISQNIELRNEEYIPISALRGLADNLYQGKPEPQKLPPMTDDEYDRTTRAALLVQNYWIIRQEAHRRQRILDEQASAEYLAQMGFDVSSAGASSDAERDLEETRQEEEAAAAAAEAAAAAAAAIQADQLAAAALLPATGEGDVELGTAGIKQPPVAGTDGTATKPAAAATAAAPKAKPVAAPAPVPPAPVRRKEQWRKPSIEVAQAFADARHPRKFPGEPERFTMAETTTGRHCCIGSLGEQCDLFGEGQVSEFGQFGPGVTTYFKFIKWNIWVFFILGVISIVPTLFNYYGPTVQNTSLNTYVMTSAGNLVSTSNSTALINIPGCVGYNYNGLDCTITPPQLARIYASLDMCSMIFLLVAYVWLRVFERKETLLLDQATVNVSDFSVKFSNLPKQCTTEEFKRHIMKVTNSQVAGVYFAYDNHHEIKGYHDRGRLVQEKYHIRQQKLYHEAMIAEKHSNGNIGPQPTCGYCCGWGWKFPCTCVKDTSDLLALWADLDEKNAQLGAKIKAMNMKLEEETHSEPLVAFVTFEEKIGALVAKSLYTVSWFSYICMEVKHKFKGCRLRIAPAPEPSTIIWENLNFTHWDRMKRRWRTAFVAGILILVSFIARLVSTIVARSADGAAGNGVCPNTFVDYTVEEQQAAVTADPQILHCYCDNVPIQNQQNDPYCRSYFQANVRALGITYGASFMVVAINMGLQFAVKKFADYEKHHSIDSKGKSIFGRLFLLYTVNTAVVYLIQINTKDLGFIQQMTGYAPATTLVNFTADWYAAIAGAIIIVQITTPLAILGNNLYAYYCFKSKIHKARADPLYALTQDELNLLHLGPVFSLPVTYAQQLASFTVCLFFSTGIPVLNVIAFFSFFFTYFVEKFLFLNYYRTPPRYNTAISQEATRMIPWIVVAHLMMSIWTLSIDGIFALTASSNTNITSSAEVAAASKSNSFVANLITTVTTEQIFPIFMLLVVVMVALVLEWLSEHFFGSVSEAFVAVFGNVCSKWGYMAEIRKYNELKKSNAKAKNAITYTRAVQRGIFKGLSTYNILQNPYYMEAFSISSKFASEHGSVNSLKFTRKQLDTGTAKVPTTASGPVALAKKSGAGAGANGATGKVKTPPVPKPNTRVKTPPAPAPAAPLTKAEIMERVFSEDN